MAGSGSSSGGGGMGFDFNNHTNMGDSTTGPVSVGGNAGVVFGSVASGSGAAAGGGLPGWAIAASLGVILVGAAVYIKSRRKP